MIRVHPGTFVPLRAEPEDWVVGSRIVVGARSSISAFAKIKVVGKGGDIVVGHRRSINSQYVLSIADGNSTGKTVTPASNRVFKPVNRELTDASTVQLANRSRYSRMQVDIRDQVSGSNCLAIRDGAEPELGLGVQASQFVRTRLHCKFQIGGLRLGILGQQS